MGSKLTLKNDIQSEFSITHKDGVGSKKLNVSDFKYIRDSVKSIPTVLDPNEGDVLLVKGYHEKGDEGYGTFIWDQNEDKVNHNGGTIIDPTKEFPSDWNDEDLKNKWFNETNSGNGCWKRLYTRSIDIKWFGAKENGITDDTLSINKAATILVKIASNSNQILIIKQLLEEIKKIDGSGSGIDSDLLDGNDSTFYTNADNIDTGTLSNDRLNNNVSLTDRDETQVGNRTWSSDILLMTNLPTDDPSVDGQLWNDNGTVKISAG